MPYQIRSVDSFYFWLSGDGTALYFAPQVFFFFGLHANSPDWHRSFAVENEITMCLIPVECILISVWTNFTLIRESYNTFFQKLRHFFLFAMLQITNMQFSMLV